jgi:hypothetical protein
MKKLLLIFCLAPFVLPAHAVDKPLTSWMVFNIKSHCTIQARGKMLLDTICNTYVHLPDAYVCIDCIPDDNFPIKPSKYFVTIDEIHNEDDRLVGEASWNEEPEATHAQSNLGKVAYLGNYCWANDSIKVCGVPINSRR